MEKNKNKNKARTWEAEKCTFCGDKLLNEIILYKASVRIVTDKQKAQQ